MAGCLSRRKVLFSLFWEQKLKEEELIIKHLMRKEIHEMYRKRSEESCFIIYVKKYLFDSETMFVDYFRITRHLFFIIYSEIKDLIARKPTRMIPKPISPMEKLCLVLR